VIRLRKDDMGRACNRQEEIVNVNRILIRKSEYVEYLSIDESIIFNWILKE
jgi:hypothetical protein